MQLNEKKLNGDSKNAIVELSILKRWNRGFDWSYNEKKEKRITVGKRTF